jgi:hypothetical protein
MRVYIRFLALVLAWSGAGASTAHAQVPDNTDARPSTQDGIYTREQARRGEELLRDECSACHMNAWFEGSFLQAWNGATVGMLYERIRSTMPEDQPSGLENREYADMLAFIFELNGIPSGEEELASRKNELDKILIQWRQP